MKLEQVSRLREYTGRTAAALCVLLVLVVLDGVSAQFRHPVDLLDVVPGQSEKLTGPVTAEMKEVGELVATTDSDHIALTFENLQTGFWLGQKMWRGTLRISPQIEAGEYILSVSIRNDPSGKPLSKYKIVVYRDHESYRRNALSLLVRYLDLSPWSALAVLFPLACLAFGAVFLLSRWEGELLAAEGRAEIYRIAKGDWGYEIAFGLGTRHGVQTGASFALLDEKGQQLCVVAVLKVSETDATAQVGIDCEVKPGYSVRML
jgi:hypothetical protein